MHRALPALLAIIVVSLLAPSALAADLTCAYRSTGCSGGEVELFGLSSATDAHAETPTGGAYTPAICCSGAAFSVSTSTCALTNTASARTAPILWLHASTDAHAEPGSGQSSYTIPICLTATNPAAVYGFDTKFQQSQPTLSGGGADASYTCAGSVSAATDAHAGQCNAYATNVWVKMREDTTPPSGTALTYAAGYSTTAALALSLNAGSDPETGIARAEVFSRKSTLADGACDSSYSSWASRSVWTPSTSSTPPTSFSATSAILNGNGCYQFRYVVTNGAGLSNDISGSDFKLDTTGPTAGALTAPSGFTTATSATISTTPGTDADSGATSAIEQQTAALDPSGCGNFGSAWDAVSSPATLTTNTCYRFRLTTTNGAGAKVSTAATTALKADSSPPATVNNVDTSQTYGQSYSFQISCADGGAVGSGCASYAVCSYDSSGTPCTLSAPIAFSTGAQSVNTWTASVDVSCPTGSVCSKVVRYASTDAAGNAEAAQSTGTINLNANIPTCTLNALSQYTRTTSVPVSWTFDAKGTTVSRFKVVARDAATGALTESTVDSPATSTTLTLENGKQYNIHCVPIDSQGATGSLGATRSTTIDATAPTASLSFKNAAGASVSRWANSDLTISWTGSDPGSAASGVTGYSLERETRTGSTVTEAFTQVATGATQTGSFDQAIVHGRTYLFRVTATDAAGNTFTTTALNVTADTQAPVCALDALPAVTGPPGTVQPKATATDDLSGVASTAIELSTTNVTWVAAASTVSLADGVQTVFRCVAADNAGNQNAPSNVSTQADLSAPTLNATHPLEASIGTTVNLVIEARDTFGLRSFTLSSGTTVIASIPSPAPNATLKTSFVASASQRGPVSFVANATDANGNSRVQTFTVTVSTCVLGTNRTCGSSIGECKPGYQLCVSSDLGNVWGLCEDQVAPSTETCDNKDNDCDALTDENVTRSGTAKAIVNKACVVATETCSAGKWAAVGTPLASFDTCGDGIDNNCDGQVDESCPCSPLGQTRRCGTTEEGACQYGTQTCTTSGWSLCDGAIEPRAEICNNLIDENCNGQTDESEACAASTPCADGPIPATGCSCGGRIYAYGSCQDGVFSVGLSAAPPGPQPAPDFELSPWLLLSAAGVGLLLLLAYLMVRFKRKGKELTWDELSKEWS